MRPGEVSRFTPSLTVRQSSYNPPEVRSADWFWLAMTGVVCFIGGLVIGLLI